LTFTRSSIVVTTIINIITNFIINIIFITNMPTALPTKLSAAHHRGLRTSRKDISSCKYRQNRLNYCAAGSLLFIKN
jgi:5-bromo-4-chloroindolyl phosphate hydrolysis protein